MGDNVILERALLALLLLGSGVGLYWLFTRLVLLRARSNNTAHVGLPNFQPGLPAILYFTTPECVACRTMQRPALQRVRDYLGENLQVIEVNAQAQPELADRWGVLSVPTTFVLDAKGEPAEVNYGAASAEKLVKQVSKVLSEELLRQMPDAECC